MSAADKPEISFVDDREADNRSDSEKGPVVRMIDNIRVLGLSEDDAEFYANFTPEQRKRTIRKVSEREPSRWGEKAIENLEGKKEKRIGRNNLKRTQVICAAMPVRSLTVKTQRKGRYPSGAHAGDPLPHLASRPRQHRQR